MFLYNEEKEILEAIEKGELESVENLEEEIDFAKRAAKGYLKKMRNVNIRISEQDLLRIKRKSAETGIPYQTIIHSLIHEFANEKIKLKI